MGAENGAEYLRRSHLGSQLNDDVGIHQNSNIIIIVY